MESFSVILYKCFSLFKKKPKFQDPHKIKSGKILKIKFKLFKFT